MFGLDQLAQRGRGSNMAGTSRIFYSGTFSLIGVSGQENDLYVGIISTVDKLKGPYHLGKTMKDFTFLNDMCMVW